MAFSYSIEADPERLRRIRESVGEKEYVCHIIWLVNMPFDSLPEPYRRVEIELYKLVRENKDVHVVVLDERKFPIVVGDLMEEFGVDSLPALIVSQRPIDLRNPDRRDSVVFKRDALKRLIEHERLVDVIWNLPTWARAGALKSRAKLESVIKPLLSSLWEEIKNLVAIYATQY